MASNPEKPSCCGECARFFRDKEDPHKGYCDEWPCILHEWCVCHPNIGRKKERRSNAH